MKISQVFEMFSVKFALLLFVGTLLTLLSGVFVSKLGLWALLLCWAGWTITIYSVAHEVRRIVMEEIGKHLEELGK